MNFYGFSIKYFLLFVRFTAMFVYKFLKKKLIFGSTFLFYYGLKDIILFLFSGISVYSNLI